MRAFVARFAIAAVVVSLLMTGAVYAANNKVTAALGTIKKVKVKVREIGPGEPANFLLLGSDTRAFATTAQQKKSFGDPNAAGGPGGQRADSIMVMHVDANAKTIRLMSIPRDTWVDIPGIGMSKINAALNGPNGDGVGGPDLLIQTIQNEFDIDINHYLAVNFDTFGKVVDAIGTIPIYFPYAVRDHNTDSGANETGLDQPMGCARLDGAHALQYVRSRYFQQNINGRWVSDPTSDLGRIKRQQEFLRILAAQAVKQGLDDPLTAGKITEKLLPNLTVDTALTNDTLLRLINAYRNVKPNDPNAIQTMTLPTTLGESSDGQSILKIDHANADGMLVAMRNFTPKIAATATTAAKAGPAPSTITVKVLNRNGGVKGGAAEALASFAQDGFMTATAGDSGRTVAKTEVRYGSGDEAKAKVVQSYLPGGAVLVPDSTITDHDITVVLGADFTGVTNPATATTTTAPTTTTSPSATTTTESPQVAAARAACV